MPWTAPPQTYLSGNTAGTTHVFGPVVTLQGGANVTISGAGNKIIFAAPAAGTMTVAGSAAMSAGTQSVSTGTVKFADSNGVTFGMSGSSQITATVKTDYLTAQTAFVLSDSNGISWGTNGSTVTATVKTDYLTTARRSTDAIGLNTAQTNVVWTVNSSGLSFDAGAYLTTARRSTDAVGLNTAKTNVTWTVNSSGLSFDAGGYAGTASAATNVGLTVNSAGISVSVPAPDGIVAIADTAQTATSGTVVFSNSNGVSFGLSGSTRMTGSVGAGATATGNLGGIAVNAATTFTSGTVVFSNSNGVTFGTNAQTITGSVVTSYRASNDAIGLNTAQTNVTWTANSSGLSLNAGGYAGTVTGATNCSVTANTAGVSVNVSLPTLSYWENPNIDGMTSWSGTSNSISIQRIFVPAQISATRADIAMNISGSSSGALSFRVNLGLYTASQSTLNSASTTSRLFSINSTSAISYTAVSGPRSWSIGLGTWNMTPGEYFLALNMAWTTASTNTVFIAPFGNGSIMNISGGETGAFANTTNFFRSGMINNNAQSTLPNTMQLSGMTQTGVAALQPWVGFHGTF